MLEKINKIRYIRSFIDFNAKNIELKKKNIIYSPNGIGKTNLSRIFEYLKNEEKNIVDLKSQEAENLDDIQYSFGFSNETITQDNFFEKKDRFRNILVFNSDYVEENFRYDVFSDNKNSFGEIEIPLGKTGAEVFILEKRLNDTKEKREKKYFQIKESLVKIQDDKVKSKEYTKKDKKIWEFFSIDKLINSSTYLVTKPKEENFQTCEIDFVDISKLDDDCKIIFNIPEINILDIDFVKIQKDLKVSKTFLISDEDTKNNIEFITKEWIEINLLQKGVIKSKEKGKCLLCKRPLDDSVDSLFEKYESYFKNEEVDFKKQIMTYKVQIEMVKNSILKINNNERTETEKFIKLLGLGENWVNFNTVVLLEKIEELIIKLEKKEANSSQEFTVNIIDKDEGEIEYNFSDVISALNKDINKNRKIIGIVNDKLTKTTGRKTELRSLIGRKMLFEFYCSQKTNIKEIKKYSELISEDLEKLEVEKNKLPKANASEYIKELFNYFLDRFLYIKKYSIEESDGVLYLKLDKVNISYDADKISAGEKNMLALCYFFASSIQQLKKPEAFFESIFIIDDPVSSTSYNYFFGICHLINAFESVIFEKIWKDNMNKLQQSNLQKIILTHNTPFFNMMRSHIFKEKENTRYLLLDRTTINEISNKQLKSEFEMALYNIKNASLTSTTEHNIGNDLRRFFETLKHFYGFSGDFNAEKLQKIFVSFENHEHQIFYTVVNYYSHGNPEALNDPLPTNFTVFIKQFDKLIKKSQFAELWNNLIKK